MTASEAHPEPRRRMHADERREHIVRVARRAFVIHGPTARTRDIAAEAEVNEALLYRHFVSKDELFAAAVVAPLEAAVARLADSASTPPVDRTTSQQEMVERTRRFCVDLVTVMEEVAPLLGVLLFGAERAAAEHFETHLTPVVDGVADVIRTNLGWWEHRPFDPDQLVRFLFGAVWFEATAARMQGRTLEPDRLADELATLVVLGLARRP
jgi:TetR/AcrR family transcriptional regulator